MRAQLSRQHLTIICPGCRAVDIARGYTDQADGGVAGEHTVPVSGANAWGFNGNLDRPTLTPSLLSSITLDGETFVCHSFITDGRIQYLADSTHKLAGKTADLPEFA